MPVTIDPCDEACAALVTRINSAITYTLPQAATYTHEIIDILDEVTGFRVDVCPETSQQLQETLDVEDRSSHLIRIWVRDKLTTDDAATVASRNLLARKIFQRISEYSTADGRCHVYDAGKDRGEIPGKLTLVKDLFYRAYIECRVEVEPS
jgi:hypothetical protein